MTSSMDTTTWHDQRPTHAPWPAELIQADQNRATVWNKYDTLTAGPEISRTQWEAVNDEIDRAENWFRKVKRAWEAGTLADMMASIKQNDETTEEF